MTEQTWVPASVMRRLTSEQRDAVRDVFDSLGALSPAAGVVHSITRAWVQDPELVGSAVESIRVRLAAANLEVEKATEQAKAAAALLLADGVTEVDTARRLGVSRSTVRRWFGRGTR